MKIFLKPRISPNLLVFIMGLSLFFYGIFRIYPPAAFAITGFILMGISIFGGETIKAGK